MPARRYTTKQIERFQRRCARTVEDRLLTMEPGDGGASVDDLDAFFRTVYGDGYSVLPGHVRDRCIAAGRSALELLGAHRR